MSVCVCVLTGTSFDVGSKGHATNRDGYCRQGFSVIGGLVSG